MSEPPSTADREEALAALRAASGEGLLTLEEQVARVERVAAAATGEELSAVTADLPALRAEPRPVRGRRWIVGVLGGGRRRGRWRLAPRCTVVNVLGGSDLDLRGALVEGGETTITVVSILGGSSIVVPEGVDAELDGFGLLGGNDLDVAGPPPGPGAPVVRVRAFSFLGGTSVRSPRDDQ